MDVWGKSPLSSVVVNTGGKGRSSQAGGTWTSIPPQQPLRGADAWETLTFTIPPRALAADKKVQQLGFGGGDSQIRIARIRVLPAGQ